MLPYGERTLNQTNTQEAKVALVTGGAKRIGAAIVKKLHLSGYQVAIHCRSALHEADILAKDLNQLRTNSAIVMQKELTELDAAEEIISKVKHWAGRLDLLVNNASVFKRTDCHFLNEADWQYLFAVNVQVPFLLSMAACPLLAPCKGSIINITDIHADKPLKGYSVYCQTKAALEMQTRSLARELAPEIRVNAVAPGAIAWPENDNSLTAEAQQKIIEKTPLKSHGSAEFIAQAVLALAENPFITGQTLKVDGGRSLTS
ncbi:TPA: pteridine reductase [Legionella pneumophila]|nr:pteridine reductase [Legionella pneumophila]HAT8641290.1 pteridine reductase [Legionella pneumophila]HAT8859126.1 pteridine reductase [Legionella pneumophila subsp. pneumophila]HAT9650486.1 pteridine reductase [Legionella pneumophila subsp. pneumophila]HAT9919926.1 pteridine reductase [Legionella pneumophila subsp. pneumophila]